MSAGELGGGTVVDVVVGPVLRPLPVWPPEGARAVIRRAMPYTAASAAPPATARERRRRTRWDVAGKVACGMAFHHVALATKDLASTHAFYTETMGFTLCKVVAAPTEAGWARHVFYDTGDGQMIAFWDLHDSKIGDAYSTDLNRSVGLPVWTNHVAFNAPDLASLAARRTHWQERGITMAEIDHGWCTSIYATDPNGILVEFCCTTRPFTAEETAQATQLLEAELPELEDAPVPVIHRPTVVAVGQGS